jgi:hypothetical protein
MSFKMLTILTIWSDFHVDELLESEVQRLILEKVISIREQSIKKATTDLIRQLEQPSKRPIGKYPSVRTSKVQTGGLKLKPLDRHVIDMSEAITKGRATFKQAMPIDRDSSINLQSRESFAQPKQDPRATKKSFVDGPPPA